MKGESGAALKVMRLPALAPLCLLLLSRMLFPDGCLAQAAAAVSDPKPNYVSSLNHLLHWPQFPVQVFIATHNTIEDQQARCVMAGFDVWVKATSGVVRYVVVNSPSSAAITVRFVSAPSLPGKTIRLGSTTVSWQGTTLKNAAMELAPRDISPEELQSVAAHEFGHALGIEGHSDNGDDLMYPTQTRYFLDGALLPSPPRSVTRRDLNTLKSGYPNLFGGSS